MGQTVIWVVADDGVLGQPWVEHHTEHDAAG